jgi:hypothetical protein
MLDILLFIFKVFIVIVFICSIPLILLFVVLGVIFFAVHFTVSELYKIFNAKIPTYDDY